MIVSIIYHRVIETRARRPDSAILVPTRVHVESPAVSLTYFHSQVFTEQFPVSSTSYSNTPTMLFRNDNFPPSDAEGVRKNNEPRKLTFPGPVNLPTPCPVQDAIPWPSLVITIPC